MVDIVGNSWPWFATWHLKPASDSKNSGGPVWYSRELRNWVPKTMFNIHIKSSIWSTSQYFWGDKNWTWHLENFAWMWDCRENRNKVQKPDLTATVMLVTLWRWQFYDIGIIVTIGNLPTSLNYQLHKLYPTPVTSIQGVSQIQSDQNMMIPQMKIHMNSA